MLTAARGFSEKRFSVIPLRPGDKRPRLPWAEYQGRRPTAQEIEAWWREEPTSGVAIVCGRVSGLIVLDIDPRNGGADSLGGRYLPRGPVVLTGGGGRHFYYAHPGGTVPKIPHALPGVDVQAEASYVVAPPSKHPSGGAYRWEPGRTLQDAPLPSMPAWLRQIVREHARTRGTGRDHAREAAPSFAVDWVLARLHGVRRERKGWVGCCPAHEDRKPSLSIGVKANGDALLNCFAGCRYVEIRAALELVVAP